MNAKYNKLFPPIVERILAEEKNAKDPVKAAKTRLHILYGAYMQGNTHKKANSLLNEFETNPQVEAILRLHSSTKERLQAYPMFYEFISGHTEGISSILDIGCGFNPFSIPLMPEKMKKSLKSYHAYDIDVQTKGILNRFFSLIGLPQNAECADLIAETPQENADIALMCKLLPVLEAQRPGRGYELAQNLNTQFLLITYPLKSLGGREKGMGHNYSVAFDKAVNDGLFGNFKPLSSKNIGNELVYILDLSRN